MNLNNSLEIQEQKKISEIIKELKTQVNEKEENLIRSNRNNAMLKSEVEIIFIVKR